MLKKLIAKSQKFELTFFALLTAAAIAIVFFKTVIFGQPISRLDLLYQLDFLYNPNLNGVTPTISQDPSTALQSFPKESYLQSCLRQCIPLTWNSLSGAGQPLIADLSNSLLNPLDLLVGTANQRLYNLAIVCKIIISGVCAYFCFVRRGAHPWAAATTGIAYALFARGLRIAELAETFLGTPIVFFAFTLLNKNDFTSYFRAALVVAFAYYSMHPEGFFVSVISAAILWCAEALSEAPESSGSTQSAQLKIFLALVVTGIVSIFLVAPSLFSFAEFLRLAYSYKYTSQGLEYLKLEQIPFYLALAKVKYSLFPGLVVLIGFPACLLAFGRNIPALLLLLSWLIFETRPGPLGNALAQSPFSYVLPEYSFSIIMLMFCFLSASGLSILASEKHKLAMRIGFLTGGVSLALVPLFLANINLSPEDYSLFVSSRVISTTIILLLIAAALITCIRVKNLAIPGAIGLLVINLCTMWQSVHAELAATKPVNFPPEDRRELIEQLQSRKDYRMIACGDRLLQPNTSLLYELADFRTCSPMIHEAYLNFVRAAGGNLGYCNMVQFPRELNSLLDFASVKYILTDCPLRSSTSKIEMENLKDSKLTDRVKLRVATGRILPGLRLQTSSAIYSPEEACIDIKLSFSTYIAQADRYHLRISLLQDGHELWGSPYKSLTALTDKVNHTSQFSYLIPAPAKAANKAIISLGILDSWTQTIVTPDGNSLHLQSNAIPLCSLGITPTKNTDITSPDKRFKLVYEDKKLLRIYENQNAVPDAYFAQGIIAVKDNDVALKMLIEEKVNGREVAIEATNNEVSLTTRNGDENAPSEQDRDRIRLIHKDNVSFTYECDPKGDSVLVQTTLNYPGWNVYIDGKRANLLRANSIFCAVHVPAGKHTVAFKYESLLLLIGNCLLAAASILSIIIQFPKIRNRVRNLEVTQ